MTSMMLSSSCASPNTSPRLLSTSRRSHSDARISSPRIKIVASPNNAEDQEQSQPRRNSREMEIEELEAEANYKEYVMFQRIMHHRRSGGGGGSQTTPNSSSLNPHDLKFPLLASQRPTLCDALLLKPRHDIYHPDDAIPYSSRSRSPSSTLSSHMLLGSALVQPRDYQPPEETDDAENDEGVFDLDM